MTVYVVKHNDEAASEEASVAFEYCGTTELNGETYDVWRSKPMREKDQYDEAAERLFDLVRDAKPDEQVIEAIADELRATEQIGRLRERDQIVKHFRDKFSQNRNAQEFATHIERELHLEKT